MNAAKDGLFRIEKVIHNFKEKIKIEVGNLKSKSAAANDNENNTAKG